MPCARSSFPDAPPKASINFEEVLAAHAAAAGSFVDHAIVREMVDGVADDVTAQRGSFLCAPHAGGMQFFAEASSRLRAGVDKGWASEHARSAVLAAALRPVLSRRRDGSQRRCAEVSAH